MAAKKIIMYSLAESFWLFAKEYGGICLINMDMWNEGAFAKSV